MNRRVRGYWKGLTVLASVLSVLRLSAQVTNRSINPEADAFVRADSPTSNYGRAGSLSVSGVQATNGFGVTGGRADSLARFEFSEYSSFLDHLFGAHDWLIVAASLDLYEMAAPNNPVFSRGIGGFEVNWLASGNDWEEGTGSPNAPTTDGVSFQDLAALLEPARDIPLGVYTNRGVDGPMTLALPLPAGLVETIKAGASGTFHFQPASETIGFTFVSRSDPRVDLRLALELIAAPGPSPQIAPLNVRSNQVRIRFLSRSDLAEILEGASALPLSSSSGLWNTVRTVPPGLGQMIEVSDALTNAHRFYRVRLAP